jgi:lysozyme
MAQAAGWLRADAQEAVDAVNRLVTVPLNQSQFDALVDFVFNLGAGAFSTSTLLRLLNGGDYAGAAGQFGRWNKDNGKVVAGLTRRRAAEAKLFEEK